LHFLSNELRTRIIDTQEEADRLGLRLGAEYAIRSAPYKGILTYLFQEAPGVAPEIQKTRFNHKSLIGLTSMYHDMVCDDFDCVDFTRSTRLQYFVSPKAGFAGLRLTMDGSDEYLNDMAGAIGVQLRIIHVQFPPGLSFVTGLDFGGRNSFGGELIIRRGYSGTATYNFDINYILFKIPVAFQYNFRTGRVQPTLSIGYNNLFLADRTGIVMRTYQYYHSPQPLDSDFKFYQMGLNAGVGLNYSLDYNKSIFVRTDFEMRMPFKHSLDKIERQRTIAGLLMFGYEFRI
jgi:hypothetical protein